VHTIGVDIGGTKIAAGVVSAEGEVLARVRRQTPATDPQAIEDAVVDAVAELRADHAVEAVGVAAAGFVDAGRSTVVFAPNLAWRDEPLGADLARALGLPVVVENDANAAGWAEFVHGAGRDVQDMVMLTIGTGLGGGVIVGGELLRGPHGFAAELGHVRVVPDGHPCGCGNRGCWEQYASGRALVREARAMVSAAGPFAQGLLDLAGGDAGAVAGPHVTAAARAGDAAAQDLLADLGRWIGEGAAGVVAVLDSSAVVVGGGVAEAGDLLLEPARAAFHRQLPARGYRPEAQLLQAELGNDAGMIGVADLARRR
jgi:glucokinase